ncbi:amidohydrolase family protein [Kaistia dalseonensis]|uniref:Cytosine deaminase n=1 Tax=Kaistia dalseonensis TaxID=410840 RepID=A0ABU0HEV3_9HYPH|nr:amidohydrolase family protein [Kaistia dalseonensis]MCX5497843.1 amidohydrolase family protein [Kaistia dalseonensis]MDQ0440487.1 cytosine deaminase [Kaistia dalseonensis]
MPFDLVLRRAHVPELSLALLAIGIRDGLIAAIEPDAAFASSDARIEDAGGRLVVPGFVDSHLHLDKSCILDRCSAEGSLAEAIAEVARLKHDFTEDDVYARAETTLVKAILQGTTRIRTHIEIDPRIGLRSFDALTRLKRDYAWAVDIEICVFPQEGLTNDPGTEELLVEACEAGADLIGGCPYTDTDPDEQIRRIFAIARRFDLDIDFHLDFDLDARWTHLDAVIAATEAAGWGGRVAVGHVTKLSAMPPDAFAAMGRRLAAAGVAVTVLPATDLFLMGRAHDHNVPRGVTPAHRLADLGVTCSLATNNVLNPFTPFGDCSLNRIANLYANIAQLGRKAELALCLDMVTTAPARLMRCADYGIAVGNPADFVVLDAIAPALAVAEIVQPLAGFKRGIKTFERAPARLLRP